MTFERLLTHPAVQAIGWALLHFVWQGALMAALVFAAHSCTRRSQVRCAIACMAMLLMPAVFLATILRERPFQAPGSPAVPIGVGAPGTETARVERGAALPIADSARPGNQRSFPLFPGRLVCLWMSGVLVLSLYTAGGWIRVQRLRRRGTEPVDPVWMAVLHDLMGRLEISRAVRLCTSAIVEVPTVIGWIRPYILLPISALTGLSESQLRGVLAHELAHIRRHDYLVNLLQDAVETLLFYHPAVWWVSGRIREEREHCCDDLAVAVCGDVLVYAGALAKLEEMRGQTSEPALAASGGDLLSRIRRLINPESSRASGPVGAGAAAAFVLGLSIVAGNTFAVRASPQDRPAAPVAKFDVASIKRCMPGDELAGTGGRGGGGGRGPRFSPGRITMQCLDLSDMIRLAYVDNGVERPVNISRSDPLNKLVRGAPAWVYSDWYTIEAETDDPEANGPADRMASPASKKLMGPMLRALLEERFALKIHSEVEEVPMYALTVAKSGLKIKPMEEGECAPWTGSPPKSGDKPPCGSNLAGVHGPNRTWDEGGVTFATFAGFALSMTLDRHVIDKTGVKGMFHFHLEYAPDETKPNRIPGGGLPVDPSSDVPPGPTIFTALEQQLGLKLVSDKGPRGYLVVDHVERPSEN